MVKLDEDTHKALLLFNRRTEAAAVAAAEGKRLTKAVKAKDDAARALKKAQDSGADPELRQAWGVTPLMVAAGLTQSDSRMVDEAKLLEALKMLALDVGANIYAIDRSGQTAIHGAANVSGNRLIEFLVSLGADPMAEDNRGRTPHDVAMRTLRPRPVTAALLRGLSNNAAPL